jgi:hypothetical protein
MVNRKNVYLALCFFIISGVLLLTACSHDDVALVTININSQHIAQKRQTNNFIDILLRFFTTDAFAASAWNSAYISLDITVSGADMDTFSVSIPPTYTSYTLEVSPGAQRKFTVTAKNSDIGINWASEVVADLKAGEEKSFDVEMMQVSEVRTVSGSTSSTVYWYENVPVDSIKIYRASNANGPYSLLGTVSASLFSFEDTTSPSGIPVYYKISSVKNGKESPLSKFYQFTRI